MKDELDINLEEAIEDERSGGITMEEVDAIMAGIAPVIKEFVQKAAVDPLTALTTRIEALEAAQRKSGGLR